MTPAHVSHAAPPLRVLIVDDEPLLRRAMQRTLQRDYEVTVSSSGEQAIEMFEGGACFDCILCDVMMANMNGTEFHRWLLENHPLQAERLAFVTGGVRCGQAAAYIRESAVRIRDKPISPVHLRGLIDEIAAHESGSQPAENRSAHLRL